MNQTQLEARLAKEQQLTKKKTKAILNNLKEIIEEALRSGQRISLNDFGHFESFTQQGRSWRDPNTGGQVWKEAHNKVRFVAYKQLKEGIN